MFKKSFFSNYFKHKVQIIKRDLFRLGFIVYFVSNYRTHMVSFKIRDGYTILFYNSVDQQWSLSTVHCSYVCLNKITDFITLGWSPTLFVSEKLQCYPTLNGGKICLSSAPPLLLEISSYLKNKVFHLFQLVQLT